MPGGDSKTEKATPKRRKDERKKGNVFFSKDIITVVTLLGAFFGLKLLFPFMYRTARDNLFSYIDKAEHITALTSGTLQEITNDTLLTGAKLIVPILCIVIFLVVLATGVQTRFIFTGKNMTPQFGRLSPLKGIKNLFSLKNVVELIKNLIKIAILLYILYQAVRGEMDVLAKTMDMDIKTSSVYLLDTVLSLVMKICLVFIAVAGFDYMYQRWDYEKKIRMSKQDMKEEYKQMEGNPEIKGKIREIQRQRARSRMMQAVPSADVVIRNPTHFAVALKYDIHKDRAPILVAKGQDELALRIVRVAQENGVHVMENKPLARAIYASTKTGNDIPEEYYATVAEILVYVYRLNQQSIT
ncbi:flagellar biosynthesis protein FlhB [Parasporobacterium paucivorans]|uniref:Flagellar biosynthetic protein FlhB n=1 Tax=Parasporobacterium paucivorans DSM 15970 TaxID=1122934 RepID=A0A1M6I9V2_9FIRM|nr:flagellar biosynthesis protein FlhB [Parasporobacterium paucivorans]SHJ31148.1 flagellar biosynthetic protein FlhB [Parasporobacterium paucivorans DSM 15970]